MTVWTDDMWATAQRMRGEGKTFPEIGDTFGFSSTRVKDKFWYMNQTDEYKQRRYDLNNERRRAIRSDNPKLPFVRRPNPVPTQPPDINTLIERNARLATPPRDLTAALCGDPRPGWSALERRA